MIHMFITLSGSIWLYVLNKKSDSATSPDCATVTWLAQLFGGIAQLRLAQLCLCNSRDCAALLAQLSGLRNSACATLRIAQLC